MATEKTIEDPRSPYDVSPDAATARTSSSEHTVTDRRDLERGESTPKNPERDVPPNGGYGWVCVACCFAINGCTWGINSTYAVFLAYYLSHDYFPNTSALAYAFIGGLSISMAMLIAPMATRCTSLYGTRITLHVGIFLETLSLIGASFATQKYQLILAQGLCFGFGMGFLFVGSVGIIPQWFTTRRSVANAIAAAGSGCGGLIWSLSTQAMIDNIGLPWAFRVLGIISGSINIICSNIIRDRNTSVGARHKAFDWTLLRRPEFLVMQAWSWFSMLGYVTVLFSLPAYARQIGLSAQQGSIIGAIFNLGQMLGRPCVGLASDRYGRLNVAAILSATCGLCCVCFWIPSEIAPDSMGLLTFAAIIIGCQSGTFWATVAPATAEVVGLQDLPSALSWTWIIMVPAVTCAEPIALELRRIGAIDFVYVYAQIFCALSYLAAGICLWVVRGWKIGELEEAERIRIKEERRAVRSEGGVAEKTGPLNDETGPTLTREISAVSIRKQGWRPRELLRRMMKPKIV